jgi:AcrR family transcriptional regulator
MPSQTTLAAGSNSKGARTRAKILDAAATLFALHGFETTTFAMIGSSCGVAIGSITHGFRDKTTLAGAVYANAMDRLASDITWALERHPTDVAVTIHAVITACFRWAEANPRDRALLKSLEKHAGFANRAGERSRLEPLLAAWAQPLIRARLLQPLTPAQLYAVILAPALFGAVASAERLDAQTPPETAWASVLSSAALAAVSAATPKSRSAKADLGDANRIPSAAAGSSPSKQGFLI